ncbi:MAG: peptidoglycan bridge formation glycyltransferase FemA/FemB family protein [Bacteroidales bacterium]|jgi:lipid II:glycine glycyltransferase (peptidoglycan interpeptide bridge formation enzyme)|nr:peptidoglycan bridge formation glycyltransferase FemA/FemB family protein [Bacteroidales bacterium]MDD4385946.1 peptidoglycan bridge formation glycyltransferase FemA/FemB family protein [Bacteroidales bacterium]MDY0196932.1 peptidoglycan bridge formation glycyltransferase FemA/FemB family protein [Tenuifilaceae bacterium]
MIYEVLHKQPEDLYSSPIVQQTAFWSTVKERMGIHTLAIDFKAALPDKSLEETHKVKRTSDLLVIIQPIDGKHTIAYVPYGPELEPAEELQGCFLEQLSESIKPYLPANCILIRYDLSWESHWAKDKDYYDSKGLWLGPPESITQEIRFNFSTEKWNLRKASTNILPSNTLFINLRNSPKAILMQMKPKTRYNIGLSERKGITVRTAGIDNLDVWYALYTETAQRNGVYLHNVEYFRSVLLAKTTNALSPADVKLLIAEKNGQPMAAMFLVISKNRAHYLYGASATEGRQYMGSYALQWAAMQTAQKMGCTEYDMFGLAPRPNPSHPMYGLYRFKTGFGGKQFHRMGCWDYPLNNDLYSLYSTLEMNNQGFHLI